MEFSRGQSIYVLTKSEQLFDVIKGLVNISLPEYFVKRIETLESDFKQGNMQDILIVDARKLEKNTHRLDQLSMKWLVINTTRTASSENYWLERGSSGELYEDDHLGTITKAIKTINNNELWFSRKILSAAVVNSNKLLISSDDYQQQYIDKLELTKKELKVFNLLVKGMTNNEIAEVCSVSINTIKTHVLNVISKSDVNSRKELMASYHKSNEEVY